MSLSNSWRIVRNTGIIVEELQAKKGEAATGARPGTTQDRDRTDNTETNPQTR